MKFENLLKYLLTCDHFVKVCIRGLKGECVYIFFSIISFVEFNPVDELDLNIEGELNIHPSIPNSELTWAAPNDLNYVYSIEVIPSEMGWPRRTLYFLSPTFSDKQRWVIALEKISDEVKKTNPKHEHVGV